MNVRTANARNYYGKLNTSEST